MRVCLPWHVCVEKYKRLFLLFSAENILQSSARCKIFRPFSFHCEPLRKLLLGNSRSGSEILFGQGITDASPRGDNSELSCHLSTSPNSKGMVSHRHETYLSSRLLLIALTEKQGKGIACNGSSLLSQFLLFSEFPMGVAKFLEPLCNSSGSRRAC